MDYGLGYRLGYGLGLGYGLRYGLELAFGFGLVLELGLCGGNGNSDREPLGSGNSAQKPRNYQHCY